MALKKAEQSDEIIVRLVELDGKRQTNVHVAFASPVAAIREVNGQELPLGTPRVGNERDLITSFTPYQPRTFAVKLAPPPAKVVRVTSQSLTLPLDLTVTSRDGAKTTGGFDGAGNAIPAEMLPKSIDYAGIRFNLPAAGDGKPDAMVSKGQQIQLPAGKFTRVYILAAAADGDQNATFKIGNKSFDLTVQQWGGYIGQWDNRLWKATSAQVPPGPNAPPGTQPTTRTNIYGEMVGMTPGFIKTAPVAWYASHHHNADGGNEPYSYSYLFAYALDIPTNSSTLTLPVNDKIRIMAITVANETERTQLVQPLVDVLGVK